MLLNTSFLHSGATYDIYYTVAESIFVTSLEHRNQHEAFDLALVLFTWD